MKIAFLTIIMFFACMFDSSAQMFFSKKEAAVVEAKTETKTTTDKTTEKEVLSSEDDSDKAKARQEIIEKTNAALLQEEQKALERARIIDEIKFSGKKSIHNNVNKQTEGERKEFIKILKSIEKKNKRNEMLSAGRTEDEIDEELEKIDNEQVNPADSKDVQTYLFKKSGLTNAE